MTEISINEPFITLYSGQPFHPFNPRIEDIKIKIIAHSLSNICRFGGHLGKFYSVGEHAYHMSFLCGSDNLAALIHDSSEGYGFVDLPAPIKHHPELVKYCFWENKTQSLIYQKYCGITEKPESVALVDKLIGTWEGKLLFPSPPKHFLKADLGISLPCWSPKKTERKFLERFYQLYKGNED